MKPTWNLRAALQDLLGRRQRHLADELRGQLDASRDAVDVALAAVRGEARGRLDALESTGDAHRSRLVTTLATTFVIPIDREDLFRFSRSVDDVLDNLQDFGRELELYGVPPDPRGLVPVLEPILGGLAGLRRAVDALEDDGRAVPDGYRAAKQAHNAVRAAYQQAIADLFAVEPTGASLKQRELLRRLDVVGLRLGEAADVLADGHLKRGG